MDEGQSRGEKKNLKGTSASEVTILTFPLRMNFFSDISHFVLKEKIKNEREQPPTPTTRKKLSGRGREGDLSRKKPKRKMRNIKCLREGI